MPRDYAATNLSIWQDDDWRALPAPAQHLYLLLQTHPEMSYCGVVDWRPGRLVGLASGWTREDICTIADCLESRYFIVRDDTSEEVLVRSWIRFDGVIRQPRLAVSMANAFAAVASNDIRGVIIHELRKIHEKEPGAGGWAKPQVAEMLAKKVLDPRSREVPGDPFAQGFAYQFGQPFGQRLDETRLGVSVPVSVPPTPAPAPAPSHQHPGNETQCASDDAPDRFDEFWNTYAKKVDRKKAEHRYKLALKKRGVTPDLLIASARSYIEFQKRENKHPQFTKDPATWLNNESWGNELVATAPPEQRATLPGGSYYTAPPPPDDMPDHLFPDWNRAHALAHRDGRPGPEDWHELAEAS